MALMLWNVRVVRSVIDGQERFAFHEVDQDTDAISERPFVPDGKDVKELYDKLRHMLGAINQPVLNLGGTENGKQ